jgi:uncharacterized protein YlxW (UPF0749 family)
VNDPDRLAEDRAGQHGPGGEPTSRDRLAESVRRPSLRGQLTVAVLLAILGFAAVVQVQANQRGADYDGMREEDLVQLLNSLSAAAQRAENEIAELEQTRSSLRSDTDNRAAVLAQAREQAALLGLLAGTLPASGPGIVVRVEDPQRAVGINLILDGLQELRNAGAEVIELNDSVRVVAQTHLEDGDEGILVDGRLVLPPYTIEAIGEPQTLEQSLSFTGGFVEDVEGPPVSGRVTVEHQESVEIASLAEPREPEYADPAPSE